VQNRECHGGNTQRTQRRTVATRHALQNGQGQLRAEFCRAVAPSRYQQLTCSFLAPQDDRALQWVPAAENRNVAERER
jgi:hypothetical protein